MALVPMRRNPLTSLLNFAADRDREAMSLGDVISQIAQPALKGMGVQTDEMTPQPAVMRGPVPTAQPLGPMTGPAMAPTLASDTAVTDDFMRRLVKQESGGNPNAVSPKGAEFFPIFGHRTIALDPPTPLFPFFLRQVCDFPA